MMIHQIFGFAVGVDVNAAVLGKECKNQLRHSRVGGNP